MTDHSQNRAIRLQSSALVLAALITTAGAITSAVIQSGWLSKPDAATAIATPRSAPAKPLASFVGTIELLSELPIPLATTTSPALSATSL